MWHQFQQGKSEGFDSCDRPHNLTQIGFKSWIFQSMWSWNLMDDSKNNRAHLLYYTKLCASLQIHQWIQTGATVRKHSIRVKIGDFVCLVWPWNLMDDLGKQLGTSSILLQAVCMISKPSVYSNWGYSSETLNSGQNRWLLFRVTLKFDGWL